MREDVIVFLIQSFKTLRPCTLNPKIQEPPVVVVECMICSCRGNRLASFCLDVHIRGKLDRHF